MSGKKNIYLEDIPLEEARHRFFSAIDGDGAAEPVKGETVALEKALGRITAEPVWASLSSPHYHASAMDGYAVPSADTAGATETSAVTLEVGPAGPAKYVDTGDPLPEWADAVIMIEDVQELETEETGAARPKPRAIEIRSAVPPWSSVRSMGEDMVATELVLPPNHRLSPVDLGAAAGSGHHTVSVRRKPAVGIIPTGTELVEPETAAGAGGVKSGEIIEYNSLVLAGWVAEWGGEPKRYKPVKDDPELLEQALSRAASENDIVLIIAGSSAGSEDYTAEIIRRTGKVLVHGIAIKPGHPAVLGLVEPPGTGAVPVIGMPGYPVSCSLVAELFLEPYLSRRLGLQPRRKPAVEAVCPKKLYSNPGLEEFIRVTLGSVDGKTVAAPLSRGAGVITSLVRADGLLRVPRLSEGIGAGATVSVELYRDPAEIERTILHIGSHDLCLDLLSLFLASYGVRFSSSNAGSLGGIAALKRGEAHLAGSHLLDPETGEYNTSYIRSHLPGREVQVISFVRRDQGLIVPRGNPKGITALEDLGGGAYRYVNRQRGAGTRVLLDYRLGQLGITPESIPGYGREEYTHLAVAAAVKSGRGDCGLGIAAAAHALGLDFIPLEQERYELIVPVHIYESELFKPLLQVLADPAFREGAEKLPGYSAEGMGEVRKLR
jgi:putative molybdopterin biosynthesis protein